MDSTTTETESVSFHSEASNYRLVREPMRNRAIGESGSFEVVGGRDYQFYDGVLTVTDVDDIQWLRDNESNGRYYWEVGVEDRANNSADLQAVIMKKALAGDFGAIAEILVAERSALSRPEVISACEAAINAGGETLPPKPDTPLHEVQRVRVGPTAGPTPGVSPDPVPGSPMVDPSTLETPPGAPAAPAEPSVPAGQVPAVGTSTMPSAEGPEAAPVEPTAPPAAGVPVPETEEPPAAPEPTGEADGAAPGAPAAP